MSPAVSAGVKTEELFEVEVGDREAVENKDHRFFEELDILVILVILVAILTCSGYCTCDT